MAEAAKVSLTRTLEVSAARFGIKRADGGYGISKRSISEASNQVVLEPASRAWINDALELISPETGEDDPKLVLNDVVFVRDHSNNSYHFEASLETRTGRIDFEMDKNGILEVKLGFLDAKPKDVTYVVLGEPGFNRVEKFGTTDFKKQQANTRVAKLAEEWETISSQEQRAAIVGTFLLPILDRS